GTGATSVAASPFLTKTLSACAVGSSLLAINSDGTVVCENAPRPGSQVSTVDSIGLVGTDSSITIGADDLGLISYYDGSNGDLKVAHCANAACSSATLATLDSAGDVGAYTSITIGADGRGLISYQNVTNDDLKVA